VLLADCDQMFVAVARLVDPDGAGRASLLVVGGSVTSRGVVCSASYEVRAFGVRSGMPIAQAARLCPHATFVPVPRKACVTKSREVARLLERWAPKVQAASIDEFYLDLSGTEAVYHHEPLAITAGRLRADIQQRSGLSVSVGGGTNRLIAKLATERAKPRPGSGGTGVFIVEPGGESEFLASHQLADIPGVGPRLTAKLGRYGLTSVRDALRVDQPTFESWLGPRSGAWLFERIRGRAGALVEPDALAKQMSHEETFPRDLSRDEELETELLQLATQLGAELRAERLTTRRITVKLRDHDFTTRQASRTLDEPIDSDRAAYLIGRELLRRLRGRRCAPARLLGIAFSMLEGDTGPAQLSLLDRHPTAPLETDRDRAVARAVDRINRRFGRESVRPARLTSRERRSP